MITLSRRGDTVFLHQPDAGMAVPVVLNLDTRRMTVAVPSIDQLDRDFAVYDSVDDLIRAAGRPHRELVQVARRFSRHYSTTFAERIEAGDMTVAGLRRLVVQDYRRAASAGDQADLPGSPRSATFELADPGRVLTAD